MRMIDEWIELDYEWDHETSSLYWPHHGTKIFKNILKLKFENIKIVRDECKVLIIEKME